MRLYPPMSAGLMLWLEASDEYDEEEKDMTLEREIELLKEKVALLEKIRDLQEMIAKDEQERHPVFVPVLPVCPTYPTNPWVTYGTTTGDVSEVAS